MADRLGQLAAFDKVLRFDYRAEPWERIFEEVAIDHPLFDDYWKARVTEGVREHPYWRVMLAPRGSLQWPWESMHVEALAWYDHWLKGRDTGILETPRIRYFVLVAKPPPYIVRMTQNAATNKTTLCILPSSQNCGVLIAFAALTFACVTSFFG